MYIADYYIYPERRSDMIDSFKNDRHATFLDSIFLLSKPRPIKENIEFMLHEMDSSHNEGVVCEWKCIWPEFLELDFDKSVDVNTAKGMILKNKKKYSELFQLTIDSNVMKDHLDDITIGVFNYAPRCYIHKLFAEYAHNFNNFISSDISNKINPTFIFVDARVGLNYDDTIRNSVLQYAQKKSVPIVLDFTKVSEEDSINSEDIMNYDVPLTTVNQTTFDVLMKEWNAAFGLFQNPEDKFEARGHFYDDTNAFKRIENAYEKLNAEWLKIHDPDREWNKINQGLLNSMD